MIMLVGHGDSTSMGLFSLVCARSVCVYHVHRICSLSCFLSFSLYPYAMLRCQKREWPIAVIEDGRLEDGHGPVMVVVVGEIGFFFSITDGRPIFLVRVLIPSTMLPEGFVFFVLPILLANETSAIAFEYMSFTCGIFLQMSADSAGDTAC